MAYNPDLRKANFGIQNCYLYPLTSTGFGDAIKQLGATGFTRKTTQEDTSIYADNRVHLKIPGVKVVEGELTFLQMSPEFYNYVGWVLNANGSLTDSGTKKPFGLAFATKEIDEVGTEKYEINVAYNVRATEPEVSKVTLEDKSEAEVMKSAYTSDPTSFAQDDTGNPVSFLKITLDNATEADVIALLEEGIPLPETDFGSYITGALSISVTDNQTILAADLQGVADVDAMLSVLGATASGGLSPYSWTISFDGVLVTYPTPDTITTGDHSVELKVTDDNGNSKTTVINITVA